MNVFANVELIWIAWASSGVLSLWLTVVAVNRVRWHHIRKLVFREDGAAYTLSYVMTVPLYILLICVFVETSLMLMAKIGTVYAAFGAARAAIVWESVDAGIAEQKASSAAVRTMTPFASGLAELRTNPPDTWEEPSGETKAFMELCRDYASQSGGTSASERYLRAKYQHASRATQVTVDVRRRDGGEVWDEDVEVTITYDYPFLFPILGKGIGMAKGDEYVFSVVSTATLQNECPRNAEKQLGISYDSSP